MDSKNARIFSLAPTGIERSIVTKGDKGFQARQRHEAHSHKDNNSEHYYRDLANRLKGADHLLLMGPGLAKKKFMDHLTAYQSETLAQKIIGIENFQSIAHKTEKQMMAQAHQFFRKYDHFDQVDLRS
jgi:stalled ribosome rescue protein Dom34